MGSRGSASGFPKNGPPAPSAPAGPKSAAEAKDLQELHDYMQTKGVEIDMASLSGQTFENVRRAASGVEAIVDEFPQAAATFNKLRGKDLEKGVLANASIGGNITLGNHYFGKTEAGLDSTYDRTVRNGFHPAGTTVRDIATHESGHILERALIQKAFPGRDPYSRLSQASAWASGTMASKVIHEAVSNLKRTPAGKGKLTNDFISDVSRYATKNRSETLAECVADYAANGSKAKPLSVAVWGILKRELG